MSCTICTLDGTDEDAEMFCFDCSHFLCEPCGEGHASEQRSSGHFTIDSDCDSSDTLRCTSHSDKYISEWCVPCDTFICQVCTYKSHRGHQRQRMQVVLANWNDTAARILPGAKKTTGESEEKLSKIQVSIASIQEIYNSTVQRIMQQSHSMKCEIDKQRAAALASLRVEFEVRHEKLKKVKAETQSAYDSAQEAVSMVTSASSAIEVVQRIRNGECISDHLEEPAAGGVCDVPECDWCPVFRPRSDCLSIGSIQLDRYQETVDVATIDIEETQRNDNIELATTSTKCLYTVKNVSEMTSPITLPSFDVQGIPWSIVLSPPCSAKSDWEIYSKSMLNVNNKWKCSAKHSIGLIGIRTKSITKVLEKLTYSDAALRGKRFWKHTDISLLISKKGLIGHTKNDAIQIELCVEADPPVWMDSGFNLVSDDESEDDDI